MLDIADDEGGTEENMNLLPVEVKEVLNEGAGVVNRKYRIEIFSNNRISMGCIDIANIEDMRRVVGNKNTQLLEGPESLRDFHALFSFIVKERLQLSMMTTDLNMRTASGKRRGMLKKIAPKGMEGEGTVIGTAGSVISLQRDDVIVKETAQKGFESEEDSDNEVGDQEFDTKNKPRIWIRLYAKRHKMSGRHFRTLVMFEGEFEQMYKRPDIFFQSQDWQVRLNALVVCFKSVDTMTKQVLELRVNGYEICPWIPVTLRVDLGHKFRRGKFGQYLIENLRLRYSVMGTYYLALFNMF